MDWPTGAMDTCGCVPPDAWDGADGTGWGGAGTDGWGVCSGAAPTEGAGSGWVGAGTGAWVGAGAWVGTGAGVGALPDDVLERLLSVPGSS